MIPGVMAAGAVRSGGPTPGNYVAEVLADNPVAYYRMGDTTGTVVKDEMGNYDATVEGSGFVFGVAGAIGQDPNTAIYKSSAGNLHSIDTPPLELTFAGGCAIEAWVIWESGVMIRDRTTVGGTFLLLESSSNVYNRMGGVNFITSNVSTSQLKDGEYHHLVLEYDGAGQINFYVDGNLADSIPGSLSGSTESDFFLFRNGVASSNNGIGTMDEVAFYDAPLGLSRVQAHYNAANRPVP